MEPVGIPISPSGLELTIATPSSGNGFHNSSSSGSGDGYKGSNIENIRELNLPAMIGGGEEVDVQITNNMEKEGQEDRQVVVHSGPPSQPRKCRRLSKAQYGLLEESYQQNNYPDKRTKQALADTLKVTLKQVHSWFVNCRSRLKKKNVEEETKKELDSYKRQVESLTNKNEHLHRKLQKLKKKLKKLKLKQTPPPMALPLPPPAAAEQHQQQNQVMYVPVIAGVFANREQNVATTTVATASFHTQQGNARAITSLPVTTNGLLLPPPSGGSNI